MRYTITLVCIALFGFSAAAQSEEKKSELEITVCPVKLTSRAAEFRANSRFAVKTDDSGSAKEIESLSKDQPQFADEDALATCIKSWKLAPAEDYMISFYYGSEAGRKNYMIVSGRSEEIRLIVPNIFDKHSELKP